MHPDWRIIPATAPAGSHGYRIDLGRVVKPLAVSIINLSRIDWSDFVRMVVRRDGDDCERPASWLTFRPDLSAVVAIPLLKIPLSIEGPPWRIKELNGRYRDLTYTMAMIGTNERLTMKAPLTVEIAIREVNA